jgi:hypothetical protein
VWTDDAPERADGEVTVLACADGTVERVELRGADQDVTLTVERDGQGRVAWIETVPRRPEPERGETGDAQPEPQRFVGASSAVDEWLAQLAPLRARRSLGALTEADLDEVGLRQPEATLRVRCAGRETTFELGARAYGSGDRYLRSVGGGPVFLVGAERVAPIEAAEQRLMERALHAFEGRDIVSLRLDAFGRSRTLQQRNRLDARRAEWVDAASPERRDETLGNWLSRFPRLRVQRYLARGARPGSDLTASTAERERVLRLDFAGERGALGFLELERLGTADPAYYAKSESTRGWVRVPTSVAQQIEDDLRALLGVAPLERAPANASSASDATGA